MECTSCQVPLPESARFCPSCAAPAPALASHGPADPLRAVLSLALGRQYEVGRLLGRGGMGAVYLATEAALEREVAIKVLPPDRGVTKDSRDRFRREARTAARLSHPNIVPLYTFGDVDGTLYFVMGYVRGESLGARLKRQGRLSVEESRRILLEIAEALDYAHKLGVIHRDIKPDNVLLEEGTGRALLTDFGVAKALGAGQTMTEVGSILGTPHYMSPEQAQGKSDIDHRADIYSLGVMGYAMLAGRLPFEGPTAGDIMAQHITKDPPPLGSLALGIPSEITSALTRSLAKDPNARWPSASEFKAALADASLNGPLPTALVPVWRGAQIAALGSVTNAYLWANRLMTPPPTDPLETRFLIDVLPPITLGVVVVAVIGLLLHGAMEARKAGHSWREIAGAAILKPDWWFGSYPKAWRARGDVWRRLPVDLRRARTLAGWALLLMFVLLPPFLMIKLNANNFYRLTGKATLAVRANTFLQAHQWLARALALVPLGLGLAGAAFEVRWKRSIRQSKLDPKMVSEAMYRDSANRSFWSHPDLAAQLIPEGPTALNQGPQKPTTARELLASIVALASSLAEPAREPGNRARAAAQGLADQLGALDRRIAGLAKAFDQAEVDRLASKLAALGAQTDDENAELREVARKQLDALRDVDGRLTAARIERARNLELLGELWHHLVGVQHASASPGALAGTTEKLRVLLARLEVPGGDAKTVAAGQSGGAEALSDAPTIER